MKDKRHSPAVDSPLSRRDFIQRGAAWACVPLLCEQCSGDANAAQLGEPNPDVARENVPPPAPGQKPRVIKVRCREALQNGAVHPRFLMEMINTMLREITGVPEADQAWKRILGTAGRVGLKFNSVGAEEIGTTATLAELLLVSLEEAGWSRDRIILLDVKESLRERLGVAVPSAGWAEEEVDFGSGRDRLSKALDEIDALINVPFLKTHHIAGFTCGLKNLSHGLIKHPARFHDQNCTPYIADIVALPALRSKLKLTLVDSLRVVWEGGPLVRRDYIEDHAMLIAGQDPVAVDSIGLEALDRIRLGHGQPPIARPQGAWPYLAAAKARGLGENQLHNIMAREIVL